MSIDPRNIIIAKISGGLSDMLGAVGAHAAMRSSGASTSEFLWPDWPDALAPEEACDLLSESLKNVGIFDNVRMRVDGELIRIEVKGCEFSHLGNFESSPIGERSVCFFGFGLIEKSLKRLTGKAYRIALERRDDVQDVCFETATPRS